MKYLLLLLIAILLSPCAYSQSTIPYRWKDNNRYLAERAECVQLLNSTRTQLSLANKVKSELSLQIQLKDKQILLLKENNDISAEKEQAAFKQLSDCNKEKLKYQGEVEKQRAHKKVWRTFGVVMTGVAVGLGGILVIN